jgi:trk system potassium uptake protein TrkH
MLSLLIFILFSISGVRLFNGLNLSMTLISTGGFLPTNSLSQIIKSNFQEIILIISFIISLLNIYFLLSIFNNQKNFFKKHYEDFLLIILVFALSIIIFLSIGNINYVETLSIVLSSINTSGISISKINNNFSFLLLILTIIGGSLISNTSGIKFIRFYILLKASFLEVLRLVKPNNIVNQNILLSNKKIDNENIKISFLIFISFFISLFILSSILLLDNFNFENSFKLSILTITNTSTSGLYGLGGINFSNLLTSSKISLIIFMIIGKIELISFFLIIKKILFKN